MKIVGICWRKSGRTAREKEAIDGESIWSWKTIKGEPKRKSHWRYQLLGQRVDEKLSFILHLFILFYFCYYANVVVNSVIFQFLMKYSSATNQEISFNCLSIGFQSISISFHFSSGSARQKLHLFPTFISLPFWIFPRGASKEKKEKGKKKKKEKKRKKRKKRERKK